MRVLTSLKRGCLDKGWMLELLPVLVIFPQNYWGSYFFQGGLRGQGLDFCVAVLIAG